MFYERPSMKMMIDGLFIKKNLSHNDFKALFGFDRKLGIPYEVMQACILKYGETLNREFPFKAEREYTNCIYNAHIRINLFFMNYMDCMIKVEYATNTDLIVYEIDFAYRTDNFHVMEVRVTEGTMYNVYHMNELVPTDKPKKGTNGRCLTNQTISFLATHISNYLVDLLYDAYLMSNKD